MTRPSAVPASSAFDGVARGAQFRDRVAIVVQAPPSAIFHALHKVALRDMKLAWALGELRYLPSRLFGHMPAVHSTRPFISLLVEGGTLILRDDPPQELITGSAAQLHRVNQEPRRFATAEAFDAFDDPGYDKLFMSVRVAPTGRAGEHWLILEHATRALSPLAERKFAQYWRVIRPMGAFVTWLLLRAVRRRAERTAVDPLGSRRLWQSAIDILTHGVTRLLVRARRVMQRKQPLGIMRRAEPTPAETLAPWEKPCLPSHHPL